jgi:predicted Zn finger-like uncharacterized protein
LIIQCDNCQTKFRLDESKLGPRGVKVKCTKCENIFIVRREEPLEEPAQAPPEAAPPAEERPEEQAPEEEKFDFGFDEEAPPEGPGEEKPTGPSLEFEGPSEEGFDFSFEEETPPEGAPEEPSVSFGEEEGPKAEEEVPEEEKFDFGVEEEAPPEGPGEEEKLTKETSERGLYLEKPPEEEATGEPGEFEPGFEEEKPFEGEPEEPSISYEEEGAGAAEAPGEERFEAGFEEQMPPSEQEGEGEGEARGEEETISFSIGEEGEEETEKPGPSEELEAPPEPEERDLFEDEVFEKEVETIESLRKKTANKKTSAILYLTLVLVIAASVSLLYLSGVVDRIAREAPPPMVAGTLEIEKLEGLFADNEKIGRVFALEGRIKNTSEEPQEIQAIKGVLYNIEGVQVSSRLVSPGRIVSKEELKTLPREDLLKHFKDLSAGFVPPKGTIPVMVVFTELPPDIAEAEIEVIR